MQGYFVYIIILRFTYNIFCLNLPLTKSGPQSCYATDMEVIYLDQLFAVNALVDYCIVLASARMAGIVLRRMRYAAAALAGAVYAAISVLPGFGWLALIPVKLAVGLGMALIAFGGERQFWRCAAVFFGTAALFGGAVCALSMASGTGMSDAALRHVTWRVLVPTFAICYAVTATVFRRRLRSASRAVVPAALTVAGHTIALRAMYDSGNVLRDPVTGKPAAVLSADALQEVLGPLPSEPVSMLEALSGIAAGARLLPYTAVGVPAGLIAAFCPERLVVDGKTQELLLALSPTPVSPGGDYDMLLPSV